MQILILDVKPGPLCTSCNYKLCKEGSEIFNNLENLELSLSAEIKLALVYIAEYTIRNYNQPREYEIHFYYEKYGNIYQFN